MSSVKVASITAVILAACLSVAMADGCYIPERAVQKIPEIPAQRALLAWRDGSETLIISSALDSEAQKLGWIIPLPTVPSKMQKASPGGLRTLTFCIQPKVTHDLSSQAWTATLLTIVGVLIWATVLFRRNRLLELLLVIILFVMLAGMLMPAMGRAGKSIAPGMSQLSVEKSARVGAYDISVLRAGRPQELADWLNDNGFAALPPAADALVLDYLQDSWVFVAIKLVRDRGGVNAPHPIALTFESAEPVYPLKLTSIAGGTATLDLFVLGEDRAVTSLLETGFCDQFKSVKDPSSLARETYETSEYYAAVHSRQMVGHPQICDVMWDGCVLTKLSGSIPAKAMVDDIRFEWRTFAPYREHFYTQQGAYTAAYIVFVILLGLFCLVSFVVWRRRFWEAHGVRQYFVRLALPAGTLIAIVAAVVFLALPKLDTGAVHVTHRFRQYHFPMRVQHLLESALVDHPDVLSKDITDIEQFLLAALIDAEGALDVSVPRPPQNRVMGDEILVEDTPGNFTVEKEAGKVTIRVYDHIGRPIVLEFPTVAQEAGSASPYGGMSSD